jgi:signal transduction histidine kinase
MRDPEVTLREIAVLSNEEFNDLSRYCLSTNSPVPLRLSFFPVGGPPLSLRCDAWRCLMKGETGIMIRLHSDGGQESRFSELTRLVEELNQECMARRHSESRLRSALAQLHDVNNIRDHMLAQVSHDLRTPLNAILGMTEFMREEPFGPLEGKYVEYMNDIHASGETLLQLVDRVLLLAWDDGEGRNRTAEALVDLKECLESCRRVVEPIARRRGLEVMVPMDLSLPRLRADQLLVKQILMNLLGNAAKYSYEGGRIEVVVRRGLGNELFIQVKDEGPGIPAERLATICGDDISTSAYIADETRGGFGLALSRRTAKAIGGELDIRSKVGAGTIASLVLPSELVDEGTAA